MGPGPPWHDRGVRSKPLLGGKPWFGPRRFGWGLQPVSPEGWALTLLALVLGTRLKRVRGDEMRWAASALGLGVVLVALLKGTSPGGHRAWAQLRAERRTAAAGRAAGG